MARSSHQYAFDVVPLLDDCIDKLQKTIDQDLTGHYDALYAMKDVLVATETTLHQYLYRVLDEEKKSLSQTSSLMQDNFSTSAANKSIMETMEALKTVLDAKQSQETIENRRVKFLNPQDPSPTRQNPYYTSRTVTDSLLFRLIVALQLCLVRIDDAYFVLSGGERIGTLPVNHDKLNKRLFLLAGCCCMLGAGAAVASLSPGVRKRMRTLRASSSSEIDSQTIVKILAEGCATLAAGKWLHGKWKTIWMTDKIVRSTNEIEHWLAQWHMIEPHSNRPLPLSGRKKYDDDSNQTEPHQKEELLDDSSRRLIEYAMKNGPKTYFWQTQGEIRFLMLKRFMDVYYASVGTAIDTQQTSSWQLPLVTGAAASFYSLTGASEKASQAVNTASRDLIQHAWGMVSLPAIKNLMLKASRLLKGAAVADRVEICGISCFILSRDPAPELAAALKRQDKQRQAIISTMSTIAESEEHSHVEAKSQKKFAGISGRYRQRDVIFHLTGGGFFAHTIASDLPYLLDWSASTGAVVVCPEYALLPEYTFPVALDQISEVYSALIDGDATIDLGFEVNRVVVTGESAGGNLAAALCVKLGTQRLDKDSLDEKACSDSFDAISTEALFEEPTRLPDAIMLSCAALNLSLEITHSRVLGTQDPVLPSGLISAISDAYLPQGFNKSDPFASPFFASDSVLRLFPPVLMFAGSNDPLLDDSVTFNERLRCLGVDSELRVAHNMPHAYWGLGTAGFPEAQQVQQECQEWLARQLHSDKS